MEKADFTHLHVHSHYSLLDGACKIEDLVTAAKKFGMSSLAITDHGNMFGVLEFYQEAQKEGIKPIIGYEAYVAPKSRRDKDAKGISDASFHLTLLAKNETGYKNLMKLASTAYLDGFYYKPRIDKEVLAEYADGLVCLSGCLKSELNHLLSNEAFDQAIAAAGAYRDMFAPDSFYLELQDNGMPEQKKVLAGAIDVAKRLGLPVVATNDIHYMSAEDSVAHDVLLCINTGKLYSDEQRMKFSTDQFYFKPQEEMIEVFSEYPEAIRNTAVIAEMCNLELKFGNIILPPFDDVPDGMTSQEYLRKLCFEKAKDRYGEVAGEVEERLNYELSVIEQTGFTTYFLIVWDFIRYAQERRIPAEARGSGVGSAVAYVLGIGTVDPIQNGLLFERFLNADRISMPDLDIDFCAKRREEVIQYVREKYGEVAQIITFGKMMARAVIRDVGRALAIPLDEVDAIAKKIPSVLKITLKEALEKEPELKEKYDNDERIKRLFDISMKLEGLARHASVHACGVVISDGDITSHVPLAKSGNVVVTQFDKVILEDAVGMLKADFLGQRSLTALDKAVKLIKETTGEDIDLYSIPLDDRETFALLGRGEAVGLFQLEASQGMRDLVRRMKPEKIEDITAAIALYRPALLQGGTVDSYVKRRHGKEEITYLHPSLEPILKDTYGIMLYQEGVMRIAHDVGRFTLNEADTLRKAMGKKKPEIMAKYRDQFVEGAVGNGVAEDTAAAIFDLMEYFAGYGFNKSHSAVYALRCYQDAYLKTHYPTQFMTALLTTEMEFIETVVSYIAECRRMGIEVLPPDVNESAVDFTMVEEKKIRFGMGAIKNVGRKAIEAVIEARNKDGKFKSLFDLCERVDLRLVNRQVLEALAKSGGLDSLPGNRAQKTAALDNALQIGNQAQQDRKRGQMTFFEAFEEAAPDDDSADETKHLPAIEEWPENDLLVKEKESLGFFISSHPLASREDVLVKFSTASTADISEKIGQNVVLGGMLTNVQEKTSRRGAKYATFVVEDLYGTCNAVMFDKYPECAELLQDDRIVFVCGEANTRNDELQITATDVIPIEHAHEKLTSKVTIKLSSSDLADRESSSESSDGEAKLLNELRDIIVAHPGKCPVVIELSIHDERRVFIRAGDGLSVSSSDEFAQAIDSLLGKGRLAFTGNGNGEGNGRKRNGKKRRNGSWQGGK